MAPNERPNGNLERRVDNLEHSVRSLDQRVLEAVATSQTIAANLPWITNTMDAMKADAARVAEELKTDSARTAAELKNDMARLAGDMKEDTEKLATKEGLDGLRSAVNNMTSRSNSLLAVASSAVLALIGGIILILLNT